jgi:putative addiction module component (TIGR02574 family)
LNVSVAAEKIAEVLALPIQDRAFLAHHLIASLDPVVDFDSEAQWRQTIDRRSREIEEGKVSCRPVGETIRDIRAKLNAHNKPS